MLKNYQNNFLFFIWNKVKLHLLLQNAFFYKKIYYKIYKHYTLAISRGDILFIKTNWDCKYNFI